MTPSECHPSLFHSSWNCSTSYKIGRFQYYGFEFMEKSAKYWASTSEKSHLCKPLYSVMNLLFFFQDSVSGWAYEQGSPVLQVNSRDTLSDRELSRERAFLDKPRIPDKWGFLLRLYYKSHIILIVTSLSQCWFLVKAGPSWSILVLLSGDKSKKMMEVASLNWKVPKWVAF